MKCGFDQASNRALALLRLALAACVASSASAAAWDAVHAAAELHVAPWGVGHAAPWGVGHVAAEVQAAVLRLPPIFLRRRCRHHPRGRNPLTILPILPTLLSKQCMASTLRDNQLYTEASAWHYTINIMRGQLHVVAQTSKQWACHLLVRCCYSLRRPE